MFSVLTEGPVLHDGPLRGGVFFNLLTLVLKSANAKKNIYIYIHKYTRELSATLKGAVNGVYFYIFLSSLTSQSTFPYKCAFMLLSRSQSGFITNQRRSISVYSGLNVLLKETYLHCGNQKPQQQGVADVISLS